MKRMGRIELGFETGLIFCFGYGIEDGELQDFFRVFDFKISGRSLFLVISGLPDTKKTFHR